MPGKIDETRPFRPLQIAVLTVSDTRSEADDRSGDTLVDLLARAGHLLAERAIIRDERKAIGERLVEWSKREDIEVILTTGGTGVTGRDVTPEALDDVADKKIPGFGELFRWLSYARIGTSTVQSRADAGIVGGVYVFILPGSPGACRDAWEGILESQLDVRHRPCNFAEMMPRLRES